MKTFVDIYNECIEKATYCDQILYEKQKAYDKYLKKISKFTLPFMNKNLTLKYYHSDRSIYILLVDDILTLKKIVQYNKIYFFTDECLLQSRFRIYAKFIENYFKGFYTDTHFTAHLFDYDVHNFRKICLGDIYFDERKDSKDYEKLVETARKLFKSLEVINMNSMTSFKETGNELVNECLHRENLSKLIELHFIERFL